MPDQGERFAIRTDLGAGWDCYQDADGRLSQTVEAQERRLLNRSMRRKIDGMIKRLDAGKDFRSRRSAKWRAFRQACLDLYNATHGDNVTDPGIMRACVGLDSHVATANLELIDP
jgi:hypothetical protein